MIFGLPGTDISRNELLGASEKTTENRPTSTEVFSTKLSSNDGTRLTRRPKEKGSAHILSLGLYPCKKDVFAGVLPICLMFPDPPTTSRVFVFAKCLHLYGVFGFHATTSDNLNAETRHCFT